MQNVITISRQYGSGGREIGQKLAGRLGAPFYDNELITRAARESGFSEAAFETAEDKATNSLLYSIAMGVSAYGSHDFSGASLSIGDRIFLAQSDVIRKVADEGPCVIVGRCADYVLKERDNVINLFIRAGLDFRISRAVEQYGIPLEKAGETVQKNDKRRSNYYNYHTCEKWENLNNYDLVIRSDLCGIDQSVETVLAFLAQA